MATAFQMIVDIYIRGKNKKAIQESLAHRRKLTSDLKSISSGDHSALLEELTQEVALLEAGLKRLEGSEEAASQDPHQALAPDHPKLVESGETTSGTDQHVPKTELETPASKQVEILLVNISKTSPGQSPAAVAPSISHRTAPVQIVGLTIAASPSEADEQNAEHVDANRADDPSA